MPLGTCWLIREETLDAWESPDSTRIGEGSDVELHSLNGTAELDGMRPFAHERVVIDLKRIPMIKYAALRRLHQKRRDLSN